LILKKYMVDILKGGISLPKVKNRKVWITQLFPKSTQSAHALDQSVRQFVWERIRKNYPSCQGMFNVCP
jgi:hypothetical protein